MSQRDKHGCISTREPQNGSTGGHCFVLFPKGKFEQLAVDELSGGQFDPQTKGIMVNDAIGKVII